MANEDSRENSVLSDALNVVGAGILIAGGIGAGMKMKSSFSKSSKNIIKNADDIVDDVSKTVKKGDILENKPVVNTDSSEVVLKNKPNIDVDSEKQRQNVERQGQKERSAERKSQQEAEAKNARQEEIERQKQKEASSGGTTKPTTLGYNDVNIGDNFKDEDGLVWLLKNKAEKDPSLDLNRDMYHYTTVDGSQRQTAFGSPQKGFEKIDTVYPNEASDRLANAIHEFDRSTEVHNATTSDFKQEAIDYNRNKYNNAYDELTSSLEEIRGYDNSYELDGRTKENFEKFSRAPESSSNQKTAEKEREKQEIAERKRKHQEEVRKRKEQEELEKKNKPASKVEQYAEKYGSPKKSNSKWRNWLRENQDSGNVADNVSQLTSNSSMLFLKDGYKEMQDTLKDGGDIGGAFDLVSSALKSKDNSYVGSKNINNLVNSNSEGSILKLQEAKRNSPDTSSIEGVDKAISKRKKDANKMKENRELNKNLLANAEDRFADSDELVTVIHGGSKSRIERFMSTGGGAYPIEMEVGGSNGKLQNVGMQFHSDYEERAIQYANRSVDGLNSTPAVVTGKVPAKYLHRNASRHSGGGDEFMLPQEHWDKMQDMKLFEPGSHEWDMGLFYDEDDVKHTATNVRKKLNITDK